jgi:type I restriction enzyme, R subunit
MPRPGEHKTVQARILQYAQDIGWTYVPRAEAEKRRGFDDDASTVEERARSASPFFGDLLHEQVCAYAEEKRELDLSVIDYDDADRPREKRRNVYEVTEEFYVHNGSYGTREDVVFLINGIPVLVMECKNASKDEAIALGVDQIRRYHNETPEVMVPEMIFTATEAIGFAYGATWSLLRRNIFNWKHEQVGNLEAKVKSFCAVPHVLRLLKDFILRPDD